MSIELLPGEEIIVGIRKHWFVFFIEIFGLLIAALVPMILAGTAEALFPEFVSSIADFNTLAIFCVAAWLILLTIIFFVIFTTYYLDILIVTNQRLIDVDQRTLFARDVATAPLRNVEDVKIESIGIFATLFHFGNLYIQTAAEQREIMIYGIRRPERAKDIIMAAYQKAISSGAGK